MTYFDGTWSANGHTDLGADWWYSGNTLYVQPVLATHWSYSNNGPMTLSYSGSLGSGSLNPGNVTRSNPSQANIGPVLSFTQGYNTTATINLSLSGFYEGSAATCSVSFNTYLGPLAPNAPGTPTDTWASDTQVNLTWANNPTSDRPYDSITVVRHDNLNADYAVVVLGGGATSYSDVGLAADRKFSHYVQAGNSAGVANSPDSNTIYTTPAAPSGCTATKTGTDVVVSWTNNSSYKTEAPVEVWHGTVTGGVTTWDGAALFTTVANAVTYTHSAPSSSSVHIYKVRAKTPSGTTRYSAYSGDSNTVQLLARPNAPTGLSVVSTKQAGATIDASVAVTFSWVHNPVDSSTMTAYEVQYQVSTDGGATWGSLVSTGKITSTSASKVYAANTWSQNRVIRWQVRTWGAYAGTAPTYSDWSAFTSIYTSTTPTCSITSGGTWTSSILAVTGAYSDADSNAQAGAKWTLSTSGGVVLETVTAGSTDTAWFLGYTFATRVSDATTYTVSYQVQDSTGLWSTVATRSVVVTYAKPPQPTLTASFVLAGGYVTGTITNTAGSPSAVYNMVYRDGVLLPALSNLPTNAVFTDPIPPLNSNPVYTVVAVSALPSTSLPSTGVAVDTTSNRVYLNSGPGMTMVASYLYSPNTDLESSREKVFRQYAGRPDPVMYSGEAMILEGGLSGNATSAELANLVTVVERPEPGCYRDPDGNRLFVGLIKISRSLGSKSPVLKGFKISVKKTAYSE